MRGNVFDNIEYSGLDLNGNRYVLKSKEAFLDKIKSEIVYMKFVKAIFYFKDDTILYISADNAVYNNQTLDIIFIREVIAFYKDGKLLAERAEYNNSENNIKVTNNVHVIDITGEIFADELFFDMNENKLDIASYKNKKINGLALTKTLENYAQAGSEYTKILAQIIVQNRLMDFEPVRLEHSVKRQELNL